MMIPVRLEVPAPARRVGSQWTREGVSGQPERCRSAPDRVRSPGLGACGIPLSWQSGQTPSPPSGAVIPGKHPFFMWSRLSVSTPPGSRTSW